MNMKNLSALLLLFFISIAIVSCSDNTTTEPTTPTTGSIYIVSNPVGAAIFNGSTNTGKVTPDSLTGLAAGTYTIKLTLDGYRDTSVVATVVAGQKSSLVVAMTSSASLLHYSGVKIFESDDPSASDPSGIILSTGRAVSIAGTSPDRPNVDIYYSSNGFIIASANVGTTMPRKTYFYIGSSSNLNDHVASPVFDANNTSWKTSIPDNTTNYVFLYDQDKHYSKFKITSTGTNPNAYANVEWLYNGTADDKRF